MTVTALGMVLTPGPDIMNLVSRSISQGRVTGLISLTGTAAGFAIYDGGKPRAGDGLRVRALALQQLQGRGRGLPGLTWPGPRGTTGNGARAARRCRSGA